MLVARISIMSKAICHLLLISRYYYIVNLYAVRGFIIGVMVTFA